MNDDTTALYAFDMTNAASVPFVPHPVYLRKTK